MEIVACIAVVSFQRAWEVHESVKAKRVKKRGRGNAGKEAPATDPRHFCQDERETIEYSPSIKSDDRFLLKMNLIYYKSGSRLDQIWPRPRKILLKF